jgi:Flp pilus assembly protein TadD
VDLFRRQESVIRCSRRTWEGLVLGLWIVAASGCLHEGRRAGPGPLASCSSKDEVALRPTQVADIQFALGRTLEKRGDVEQARLAYLEAVKQDPNRGDAYARLAVLCDCQGQFEQSAEYYRKANLCQGDSCALSCNLGYSYYLQRRWADAESSLRHALVLEPSNQRAHNNLGLVLAHAGQTEEALHEFSRAGCTESEAHANLALALAGEGKWPEARLHYEQALATDPTSSVARKGLQTINDLVARSRHDVDSLLRAEGPPADLAKMHASSVSTVPTTKSDGTGGMNALE